MTADTQVDEARYLKDFRTMSRFGATPASGVHREAATDADVATHNWFAGLIEGYGATVVRDEVGNLFGLWELVPGAPYVLVGSHLDSQPFGGKYDGAYGVLTGAHACAALARAVEAGEATASLNVAVVAWFNEEGSRFEPSMMGSSVFTGKTTVAETMAITDRAGISVGQALTEAGMVGDLAADVTTRPPEDGPVFACYGEIHIEQGKSMWENGQKIGLVESTWAASKYDLVVHGFQSHTGSTLLPDRRDALLGAAMIITRIREIGEKYSTGAHPVVTSCGELEVVPNSPVVVAQKASLLVDLRCGNEEILRAADAEFAAGLSDIEKAANVEIEKRSSHSWGAQPYQPEGVELAERVVRELGYTHVRTRTLAGHDSTNVKDVLPTIMLFVPSVDGITHNEHEYTTDEDMLTGLHMFTAVVGQMASGALRKDG